MIWMCWGLTSQSTIFQSCRDGAIASWVINQYFRGVKCLAQGHNMAEVGLEPRTSRSGVRHSTTEPPRSLMRSDELLIAKGGEPRVGTYRLCEQWVKRNLQKARSLAPLNGWACAVKICHDGMLEDTNSLDAPHMTYNCLVPHGVYSGMW